MQYDIFKQILQTFGSMPKNVLSHYAAAWLDIPESKADGIINIQAQHRQFYYDKNDEWCYLFQGHPQNYAGPFVLDIIDRLGGGSPLRIAKAVYPFDYIFEAENNLYQVIDCFNEGIYKLNFRKHMKDTYEQKEHPIIPILMMRNKSIHEISRELYPEGEFYFATAEFDIHDMTKVKTTFTKGGEK